MLPITTFTMETWVALLGLVFFLGLVCFVILAAHIVKALHALSGKPDRTEITNSPLLMQEHVPFATTQQLEEVRRDVEVVDEDLKLLKKEIIANGETRRQSIESKVESVRKELTERMEADRHELAGKIDGMEARTISMLNNAFGFIGGRK